MLCSDGLLPLAGALECWRGRAWGSRRRCLCALLYFWCTLVVFRPYDRRLEMFLSLFFSFLQVVQAACSVAVTLSTSQSVARVGLSWTTLLLSWGLMMQVVVAALWVCVVAARRHQIRSRMGGSLSSSAVAGTSGRRRWRNGAVGTERR